MRNYITHVLSIAALLVCQLDSVYWHGWLLTFHHLLISYGFHTMELLPTPLETLKVCLIETILFLITINFVYRFEQHF